MQENDSRCFEAQSLHNKKILNQTAREMEAVSELEEITTAMKDRSK